MSSSQKLGIVGGGITGLAVAYELLNRGHDITIFEKNETGGLIGSIRIGESYLESFYHHLFMVDKPLLELVAEIGLQDSLLWKESPMGFFCNGSMYGFGTPADLLRFSPLSFLDRLKFGLSVLYFKKLNNWEKLDSIPIEEWFRKYGLSNVFKQVWEPLLRLKFGDDYRTISAAWIWGRIHPRANSRHKGREKLGYFRGGYHIFVEKLVETIRSMGGVIHEGTGSDRIIVQDDKAVAIRAGESVHEFDAVIVTLAPKIFRHICPEMPPHYMHYLETFKYNGALCLILELDRRLGKYYWLNINDREIPFGGVIEHTNFIPPSEYGGSHLVYFFNYLPETHRYFRMEKEELLEEYWSGMRKIFPQLERQWIKNMYVTKTGFATPVYFLNYARNKPAYETPLKNLFMVNMTQIYPEDRNVSGCIKIARDFCAKHIA